MRRIQRLHNSSPAFSKSRAAGVTLVSGPVEPYAIAVGAERNKLRDDSKTTSAFCIYLMLVLVVVLALVHIEEEDEDEQEETPKLFLSGP